MPERGVEHGVNLGGFGGFAAEVVGCDCCDDCVDSRGLGFPFTAGFSAKKRVKIQFNKRAYGSAKRAGAVDFSILTSGALTSQF